jgi:hypothetical protein
MKWCAIAAMLTTVAALGASACTSKNVVTCDPAGHGAGCLQGGISGTCVTLCDGSASYCAFPAPADCPGSGLKFGVLSGDESTKCVETCSVTDGDAGVADGGPSVDAGPAAPSTVYVSFDLVDQTQLFDADDLTNLGSVPLPATQPSGYRLFLDGAFLWATSEHNVVKYDLLSKVVASGYPRYFDAIHTCAPRYSVFGPEGWTCIDGSRLERWTGEPLAPSSSRSLTDGNFLARSDSRVFAVTGQSSDQVFVYDVNSLNPAPGSPLAGDAIHFVQSNSEMDRTVLMSWGDDPGFHVFRESTLEPVGKVATTTSAAPFAVGFDSRRNRIVTSIGFGFVASYSATNLSLVVPPKGVSSGIISSMVFDRERDRFYCAAGVNAGELVVLDGATLDNVAGSPVSLEFSAASVVLH